MKRHATDSMSGGFCFALLGSGAERSVFQQGIFLPSPAKLLTSHGTRRTTGEGFNLTDRR